MREILMRSIIEKSGMITLRLTEENDLDFVISSEQEPDNAQFVGHWTKQQHLDALHNTDVLHIIIEDSITCKSYGYVIMVGLENVNRSIEFKRIVICEKGKGIGREAIKLIKKITFEQLMAHRLWLDVKGKNYRAQNIYKSEGFKEEGVLRDCIFCDDNYESLIVMSMLEKEY